MTETKDRRTRIYRHEYSTVTPDQCRENIEALSCINKAYHGNNVHRYLAELNGVPIEIRATPTRVIFFSPSRQALLEVARMANYQEWEYDNTTERTDYMGVAK